MVVCKFFLQGSCKFDDKCKFDHIINDPPNSETGKSIMRPRTSETIDIATLVKAAQSDMICCEKSGQWILSAFAPFKERPNYPGFEDHSMEEIRLGFYEATASGTIDFYKQQLQEKLTSTMQKIRTIQNPNQQVAQILHHLYSNPIRSSQKAVFAQSQGNQAIGASQFGNATAFVPPSNSFPPQGIANLPNQTFTSPKSIFGGQNTVQTRQSQPQQINPGNPVVGGNIFAHAAQNYQPPNQLPPQQIAQTPIFANVATAQQPVATTGNIFAQAAQKMPVFNTTAAPPSIFPSNIIPMTPASNTPFATQAKTTGNIFNQNKPSGTIQGNPNIFGGASNAKPKSASSFYSTLEDLGESLCRLFKEEKFSFGKIPELPPSAELC